MFKDDGLPENMICNGTPEQVSGEAARLCQLADCTVQQLKRGTPRSNRAEGNISIAKSEKLLDLKQSNCPMVLWCYAAEGKGKILAITYRNIYPLGGKNYFHCANRKTYRHIGACRNWLVKVGILPGL